MEKDKPSGLQGYGLCRKIADILTNAEDEACNKWYRGHGKLSNRNLLRMAIDAVLEKRLKDVDALFALLKSSGYSVARKGKQSLRHES